MIKWICQYWYCYSKLFLVRKRNSFSPHFSIRRSCFCEITHSFKNTAQTVAGWPNTPFTL